MLEMVFVTDPNLRAGISDIKGSNYFRGTSWDYLTLEDDA